MGLFGKKNLDAQKMFDTVTSGIDKMFYTNEERAEADMERVRAHTEYVKGTLEENGTRSVTRRYLAVMIMAVFLGLVVGAVAAYPFDREYAKFIFEVATSIFTLAMMVAAFFFGSHMIRNVMDKRKRNGRKA
ncbi:hypothetical protein FUAX_40870 (plasmid) [Fulvitalea axinellae]|uniref:Holin-X, holin superfamily III n=1 Tax=Fulvitalea axinellae TaxID=1182444 RepID=A0AAU9DGH7_9BACT|nr:hypothetical protein FUAX_33030 [Fulvitalea axinellae]BDD11655.1 hypothetical protein FUAX_40870 [Fulvitalea axinellae]